MWDIKMAALDTFSLLYTLDYMDVWLDSFNINLNFPHIRGNRDSWIVNPKSNSFTDFLGKKRKAVEAIHV